MRPIAVSQPRGLTLYKAPERLGLSPIVAKAAALTVILVGLSTAGCSLGPFADLRDSEATSSIKALHAKTQEPTEKDLALARNAASELLTRGAKDASQPWENPETGARGSVTSLASSYSSADGRTCRDILASYVNGDTQSWLQGAACKSGHGRWEIDALKPWRRG